MEVVDPGPNPKVQREKVCPSCGATLRYIKPDVKRIDYKDYDGGSDTRFEIQCPQCKEKMNVKPWF